MSLFNLLKESGNVLLEAGKIEQYKQILEAQSQSLVMQEENQNLKKENKELKEKFTTKENLVFENNLYYLIRDNKKEGPFCSCCWDSELKLIRLHISSGNGNAHCPECETIAVHGKVVFFQPNHSRNQGFI